MIEILNENLKKIDILRKYTFAQYTRKFREIGTFQINVRLEKENLYLLEKDKEYYVLFDSKIFGKIEDVKKESDSEYERTIVLSGRLSNVLFTKRVVAGTINFKGNTAQFVKAVIENEITKDKESKRYVNIDIKYDDEKYLESFCSLIDKQVTGGYVWDIIQPSLEQDRLGIYFNPVVETEHTLNDGTNTNISKWTLLISAGKDRRKGNVQGNIPVIFSQSLSNIARTDYELNLKEHRNVAYVAGEGEEDKRKWYEVYPKEEEKNGNVNVSGWGRSELWIDARDIQSENAESGTITEEEYEKLIKQRAGEKFSENTKQEMYTGTLTEANKQYEYGTDYDLGDIVTIIDNELGIVLDVQITDVIISLQGNRQLVDIEFMYGKVNREPVDRLENMEGVISQSVNSIKYLENLTSNLKNKKVEYITVETSKVGYGTSIRVKFDNVIEKLGESFELLSDGGVLVKSDVDIVRVSASIGVKTNSTRSWARIYLSRGGRLTSIVQGLQYGQYNIFSLNRIIKAKKGDIFFAKVEETEGYNIDGLSSVMSVEKLC